jgi:[protein-PII] uridylyltransferase
MAANGMNILGAQIFTQGNGVALDTLQVRSPSGELITNPEKWQRVEEDLISVIEGRARVEDLMKKRHRPSLLTGRPMPRSPNRVEIDNEVSDEYTVSICPARSACFIRSPRR